MPDSSDEQPTRSLGPDSESRKFPPGPAAPPPLPAEIGAYRILELLGEGGMGVVYLAEQRQPIRRKVALKVIKLGMDTKEVIGRFEAERQALAMMDHPNIAKIFDAGTTDKGQPFFVMEHVPGTPLTDYCDRHQLTVKERLKIFVPICQAIHHAHQKAVIHRDIKPGNILVMVQDGSPFPKVIDFGVAKAISHRLTEKTFFTEQGLLLGTPAYMSPEQAEMTGLNVDTTTDIYSLGVVLYRLLSGTLPFDPKSLRDAGLLGLHRIIRETDPPKPSTRFCTLDQEKAQAIAKLHRSNPQLLGRQVRGELDWITMKAMDKDRTRRYPSASELAMDVQRYLDGRAVVAGPPNASYRVRRFVRRHSAIIGLVSAVLLSLLIGLIGMTALYFKAESSRQLAREATKEARWQSYIANVRSAASQIAARKTDEAKRSIAECPEEYRGWEWHHLAALVDGSRVTLSADAAIVSADLSPDGVSLAVGTAAGEIQLWDLHERQLSAVLRGHESLVSSVAFERDGHRLVSASIDSTIRVWDLKTNSCQSVLRRHDPWVFSCQIDATGRLAMTAGPDGARLWNLAEGTGRRVLDGPYFAVARNPIDNMFAVGKAGVVHLFEPTSGTLLATLPMHTEKERPFFLDFDSAGRRLAAGGSDGSVGVWSLENSTLRRFSASHDELINTVKFSNSGKWLVTAAEDRTMCVWNSDSGKRLGSILAHSGAVSAAFPMPGDSSIVSTSEDGTIRIWSVRDIVSSTASRDPDDSIEAMAISSNGKLLATGGHNGVIEVWSLREDERLAVLEGHTAKVLGIGWSHDATELVSASADSTVRLWNVASGTATRVLEGHDDEVNLAVFRVGGQQVLSCSDDGTVRIWDTERGECVRVVESHEGLVLGMVQREMDPMHWTASDDGTIRGWSETGEEIFLFGTPQAAQDPTFEIDGEKFKVTTNDRREFRHLCLVAEKSVLVAAGNRNEIVLLDTRTGTLVKTFPGPSPTCLAATSDDTRILTGTSGGELAVWDVERGFIVALPGHTSSVQSIAVSPKGRTVVTASENGATQLWR